MKYLIKSIIKQIKAYVPTLNSERLLSCQHSVLPHGPMTKVLQRTAQYWSWCGAAFPALLQVAEPGAARSGAPRLGRLGILLMVVPMPQAAGWQYCAAKLGWCKSQHVRHFLIAPLLGLGTMLEFIENLWNSMEIIASR